MNGNEFEKGKGSSDTYLSNYGIFWETDLTGFWGGGGKFGKHSSY